MRRITAGGRPMPKTPGRQAMIRPAAPSVAQRRALGEVAQLQRSIIGPEPQLQIPARPTLYDPNTPTVQYGTLPGLGWSVPTGATSDYSLLRDAQNASVPPSQLRIDAARNTAKGRGLQAAYSNLSSLLDSNPDQEGIQLPGYTPYTPQNITPRQYAPLPTQNAPQADRFSLLLSALGGAIAPEAAGRFAAMPLTTATLQTQQDWEQALQRYQMEQGIYDTQYGDTLQARNDTISTDLYNRQGLQANEATNRDLAYRLGNLDQQQTETNSLGTLLNPLMTQEDAATQQGLEANRIQQRINQGLNTNTLKTNQYLADVSGAVEGYRLQQADRLKRLELAASMGDKAAQRMLDAMRISETGRHNRAIEGISGYNATTGRLNASTSRLNAETQSRRFAMDQWKARVDPNHNIEVLVEKDTEVSRAYDRYVTAKQNYDNMALSTDKNGQALPRNTESFNRAIEMVRAAEKALQDSKDRAWNRYAPSLGIPSLPSQFTGAANTPALRNVPIQTPGSYSLGVGEVTTTTTKTQQSGSSAGAARRRKPSGEKGVKGALR